MAMSNLAITLVNFIRAEIDNRELSVLQDRGQQVEAALRKIIREELVANKVLVQCDPMD